MAPAPGDFPGVNLHRPDMFHGFGENCGLDTQDECRNDFKAAGYVPG